MEVVVFSQVLDQLIILEVAVDILLVVERGTHGRRVALALEYLRRNPIEEERGEQGVREVLLLDNPESLGQHIEAGVDRQGRRRLHGAERSY